MSIATWSRRLPASVALILAILLAVPARAVNPVSYHLGGVVTRVAGTGGAVSTLDGLGVKQKAAVAIDWTVDLDTPAQAGDPNSVTRSYLLAITSLSIQIGGWTASGANPSGSNTVNVNKILVHDQAPGLDDFMDLFRSGTDLNGTLTGNDPNGAQILLHFFAPGGGASSSNDLGDQTPSLYPESTGVVVGTNAEVTFAIPGLTPASDPTQKCRAADIAAAATLCKATFACLASNAKAPNKDPGNLKLDACRTKADQRFVIAYDKAAAAAAAKGLSCGTNEPGATLVAHVDDGVDAVIAFAGTIDPPLPAVVSGWYAAAGGLCSSALTAESKNVKKPDPATLSQSRATARAKLTAAATKALAKAEKQGVVFDPEPDVAALIAQLDALIDALVAELNGVP